MAIEVKVPPFSESISEGTLVSIKKKVGDRVERDELLAEIETDKVVLEVTAQQAGAVTAVLKAEGDVVKSGEVILSLDPAAASAPAPVPAAATAAAEAPTPAVATAAAPTAPAAAPATAAAHGPAVRKLAAESGVDLNGVAASGKAGRVTKGDLLAHLATGGKVSRPEQRVPMTRIRQRIADRLKEVQNTAAVLTTFNEVNMQPVMDLRKKYQDAFTKKHGVKLGFMSFFVKAVTEALKAHPVINASVEGKDIIYHGYFDIGIAVATDRGLVVPILRDTERMSLADIEKQIAEFGTRARANKLSLDDLQGGTFSITNGGIFGSMLSTPILNAPQSAILGMHNIVERPVAENGQVVIRPVMYLALSYDHRIIDGSDAVQFLVKVRDALQDPARMLLEV
ncbi:MAG: 2-oxoglutarate dehydrogenase complex dihydrolipoyllysine-residue succinyltransferase [Candidatus Sericytochromatia bacterium]|nr:2-oxoglutarate dehydrogenase complex dihydrolipoyllysine-residue succinyltransferase [Candidatus Sericytochromatia bacterium]